MAKRQSKGSERLRGKMMEMVKRGQKTLMAASLELGISYRQAKYFWKENPSFQLFRFFSKIL